MVGLVQLLAKRPPEKNNLSVNPLTTEFFPQREQLDSGGGGALSQGAGHDGSFFR